MALENYFKTLVGPCLNGKIERNTIQAKTKYQWEQTNELQFIDLTGVIRIVLERRKAKTKVSTLTNNKGHRQYSQPIKTRSNSTQLTDQSAEKRVRLILIFISD